MQEIIEYIKLNKNETKNKINKQTNKKQQQQKPI